MHLNVSFAAFVIHTFFFYKRHIIRYLTILYADSIALDKTFSHVVHVFLIFFAVFNLYRLCAKYGSMSFICDDI